MKGWIDRELDHKMILRHDDPLVEPLEALGEPIFKLESNPTVERIAKLIFDKSPRAGPGHRRGPRLGDADVVRGVQRGLNQTPSLELAAQILTCTGTGGWSRS